MAEQPKKKERAPPPPAPPGVCTTCLLVRYAVNSLLASPSNDSLPLECAPFQATYMKDKPRLTGKVGYTASKAVAARTPLLDDKATALQGTCGDDASVFWERLERVLQRLLNGEYSVSYAQVTKQSLFDTYGQDLASTALLEESHVGKKSKTKPNDPLVLAVLHDTDKTAVFACVVPGIPYASPSAALESIVVDRTQTQLASGKKGFQISCKWEVHLQNENAETAPLVESLPERIPTVALAPEAKDLVDALLHESKPKAEEDADSSKPQSQQPQQSQEMKVDPFNVEGTIDYNKLVQQFGSTLIDDDLMKRFEALTVGRGTVPHLHRFLRRGMFFSHRDLGQVVTCLEQNQAPIYLYTGRGPSSSAMHLGHLVPFLFTQWLQRALNCPLVIQMTDDEKFLFKGEYDDTAGDNLDHFAHLTLENARDIIACGFDYDKTFLFSDLDYVGTMYPNICRIWKAVTTNTVNNMFGFDGSSNMGKIAFPAIQAAPSFASSFPTVLGVPPDQRRQTQQMCLIPCAIDQDPYFRMTRDVAHKLVDKTVHPLGGKPALIHSKFFPPLQGAQGKMSSSNTNSAIFLTDTADEIAQKIRSFCFSGGRETKAEQEKYGADIEVDVAYQWLRFFLEDDEELEQIGKDYSSGSGEYWSTGKVKERLIVVLQELVAQHQERRAKITDDEVRKWMTERSILVPKES